MGLIVKQIISKKSEYLAYYNNKINIIKGILNTYINQDIIGKYNNVIENTKKVEYSIGGECFSYGIYSPEKLYSKLSSNKKTGKKIKNPEKGYTFKYYFDSEGKLVLIEKKDEHDRIYKIIFFEYDERVTVMLHYNLLQKKINDISFSCYDDNDRIINYVETNHIYNRNEIFGFEEQIYTYRDGLIEIELKTSKYQDFINRITFYIEKYTLENNVLELVDEKEMFISIE